MFEHIVNFFKKFSKEEKKDSKETAKERLHLVLMQDRANVSADFLELMKQEIIDVIKKYIDVDENSIDVKLTNKPNSDGTNGAPALYANIPIISIKDDSKKIKEETEVTNQEEGEITEEIRNKEVENIKEQGEQKQEEENRQEVEEKEEQTQAIEQEKENKKQEENTDKIEVR